MGFWIFAAVLGSHFMGIQLGTGMLDLVLAYLFFAAIDSLFSRRYLLAAVEAAFFFWAKSFIPFQFTLILTLGLSLTLVFKRLGFKIQWLFHGGQVCLDRNGLTRFLIFWLLVSCVVAGPFVVKSFQAAGTPLYPFFAGMFQTTSAVEDPVFWQTKLEYAPRFMEVKDQYGLPRTGLNFIRHLWLIAVPTKDVNNQFDYPVGLPYLLCIIPFVGFFIDSLFKKRFVILAWFVVIYWGLWWFGSQQSRFLYIPVFMMFLIVLIDHSQNRLVLKGALTFALLLTFVSVFRAHRSGFGRSDLSVLRPKDRQLLEMNKSWPGDKIMDLDYFDVAYAAFPVNVTRPTRYFVFRQD
jgi:hypothetical protein